MYDTFAMIGPRQLSQNDGGTVGYFREGFLAVQNAIANSYVKQQTDTEMPNILMQVSARIKNVYGSLKG